MAEFGKKRRPLPGDRDFKRKVERIIRVDQAGEFGATRIYAGQLAVLGHKDTPEVDAIRHMAAQEEQHREVFDQIIHKRRVRPTALTPLWRHAGFALGAATALLGEKAAMACTEAVEEAIDEHYANQAELLGSDEAELKSIIQKFRDEEIEHKQAAIDHGSNQAPIYPVLKAAIKNGSKLAIWLSERI